MLTRDKWRVVGMAALAAWAVSLLLPGWGGWLALPFCALWLTAFALSQPPPAFAGRRRTIQRFRRNLKWMPANTVFGAVVASGGWWWLSYWGPSGWSAVAFGVVWPPFVIWMAATGRLGREQRFEVDAVEVRLLEDDDVLQRVRWADLQQVEIVTTAAGPWNEDMFWVLSPAVDGGRVAIPNGLAHAEVVPRLLQLPTFDKNRVLDALGSVSDAVFIVWQRDSSETSEPSAVR